MSANKKSIELNELKELMIKYLPEYLNEKDFDKKIELLLKYFNTKKNSDKYLENLLKGVSDETIRSAIKRELTDLDYLFDSIFDYIIPKYDKYGKQLELYDLPSYIKNMVEEKLKILYQFTWNKESGIIFRRESFSDDSVSFGVNRFISQIFYDIVKAFSISTKPYCGDFICRCKNCNKIIGKTRASREYCDEKCRQNVKSRRLYNEKKTTFTT